MDRPLLRFRVAGIRVEVQAAFVLTLAATGFALREDFRRVAALAGALRSRG